MPFVHRLNLQLSISQLRRLTLAIVLSPGFFDQIGQKILPPAGAAFLERSAFTKRPTFNIVQTLRGATNH